MHDQGAAGVVRSGLGGLENREKFLAFRAVPAARRGCEALKEAGLEGDSPGVRIP